MNLSLFMNLSHGAYGVKHLIILFICISVVVIGTILSIKKLQQKDFYKILLVIGIVSESIKVITYVIMNENTMGGYLPKTDLPFHLCSIQLIFIALLNFSKNEKLKHTIEGFMIPTRLIGGLAALLIPTSSSLNNFSITIQYYLFHTGIITFASYLLFNKNIKFSVKDYLNTIIMLVGFLFVAIYLNSILYYQTYELIDGELVSKYVNVNFMYVVNPPVSNLPFLNKNHGWGVYIAHYAILCIFATTLVYLGPIIDSFGKRKIR